MLILLTLAAYAGTVWLPRLLVASIVVIAATVLAWQVARTTRLLLEHRRTELDFKRKPTRAERGLMRASLRLALYQTELRSLFPALMAWVDERSA